jgi:hypothetical protein
VAGDLSSATLEAYTYIKFKHQVLIVNPMTRKIVDMFSES